MARRAKTGAALELFACDYDAKIDAGRVATVWSPEAGARELLLAAATDASSMRPQLRCASAAARHGRCRLGTIRSRTQSSSAPPPSYLARGEGHASSYAASSALCLTNTDWQLILECPVPLLLVKRRAIAAVTTVLIAAVDPLHVHDKPAALDNAIYEFAAELCQAAGGALHLVHASAPPLGIEPAPSSSARRNSTAEPLRSSSRPTPLPATAFTCSKACRTIVSAAVATARGFPGDGCRRQARRQKVMIGSTAARVLDRLPCDS